MRAAAAAACAAAARHVHRYGRGRDVCVRKRVSAAVLVQYTRWIAKQENREAGVKLKQQKRCVLLFCLCCCETTCYQIHLIIP